jgi:hypothetical protein
LRRRDCSAPIPGSPLPALASTTNRNARLIFPIFFEVERGFAGTQSLHQFGWADAIFESVAGEKQTVGFGLIHLRKIDERQVDLREVSSPSIQSPQARCIFSTVLFPMTRQ